MPRCLNQVGYFIVGLFIVTWTVALAVWRFGRIEEKWTASDGQDVMLRP